MPPFWAEDPVSWFRLAEGQFTLRNVADPIARYYQVLSSLSQDAVRLVHHVLHEETSPDSYTNLRTLLMASDSLSYYQKMEIMMKLPPLGDRKPLVMLAEMLEYCPVGKLTTAVFAYLLLQQLPREIRMLLSEDDPADVRVITDKADRLIAMHVPQDHDTCAAIAGSEDSDPGKLVAATQGARRKKFKLPCALSSSRRAWVSGRTLLVAPRASRAA